MSASRSPMPRRTGRRGRGETPRAAGASEATVTLTVPHPHRWHGRRDPYVYTATARLLSPGEDHTALDAVAQPVGFRTFASIRAGLHPQR